MKKTFRKSILTRLLIAFSITIIFTNSYGQQEAPAGGTDGIPEDEAAIANGETLFNNNCKQCHMIFERVVGPPLMGTHENHTIEWLTAFINNSQRVIQSGDEYAVALWEEYNKLEMPAHDFSDDEILSLLAYIKAETDKGPAVAEEVAAGTDEATTAATGSKLLSSGYLTILLVALLIVLALILVVLVMLISVLTRYLKQKAGLDETDLEVLEDRTDIRKLISSPAAIWITTFIFTAIVLKVVIDGLYGVGIQEGYAPTQPIAYSHLVHAGQYEIQCEYCHTGVMHSKNANIPSANICMNCHSGILNKPGTTEVSEEIMKIYEAVENNQPIEWVRIHNLPDLAYFNHAQHYNVGNIECQTCHGPIEEMEVVSQFSNLTMGWCIDCHRTNEVVTEGNDYYAHLVEVHSKTSDKPLTVEDIGGLECSKCHY
jgi:mono/diheme cytochrome c family protein